MTECLVAVASVVAAVGSVMTAVVTWVFYSQLVANDNSRERRVERDRLKLRIKNELWPNRTSPGSIQKIGNSWIQKYPKDVEIVFEVWDDIYFEAMKLGAPPLTTADFRQSLRDYNPQFWDQHDKFQTSVKKR